MSRLKCFGGKIVFLQKNSKFFLSKNVKKEIKYSSAWRRRRKETIQRAEIAKSKKLELDLIELCKIFQKKQIPEMPIKANILMTKYKIPEGKMLGKKLKTIEKEWVNNNFKISDQEVENIIKD